MGRINFCGACTNLKFGVKTRIKVDHTCGKTHGEILEELKNIDEQTETERFLQIKTWCDKCGQFLETCRCKP